MRPRGLDGGAARALNRLMDACRPLHQKVSPADSRHGPGAACRPERRAAVRTAGAIRDLQRAAAFEDSQWPALRLEEDAWLFAGPSSADADRADALAGRGMSVVQWRAGDCHGCVRDLAPCGEGAAGAVDSRSCTAR